MISDPKIAENYSSARGSFRLPARPLPLYQGGYFDQEAQAQRAFEIQLALSGDQRASALDLINRMYSWRGYGTDHKLNERANCATFAAIVESEMVGTLSLTVDSQLGLAADKTFRDLLDDARATEGVKICELTKFAFSPTIMSMHVLASLFHTIFIFGTLKFDCTDLFIEVNPRHIRFYKAMLGFSLVDGLRTNASVEAPSQLMRLKVADIDRYIAENVGNQGQARRSLYPYFLTAAQEMVIYERMANIDRRWPFQN